MKPVDQDKFGIAGNCLAACCASILDLELADVPSFAAEADWYAAIDAWVFSRWLYLRMKPRGKPPAGYSIACGPSPRYEGLGHACVALDGVVVHDPHPERAGLAEIWHYYVLRKIETT